jgi:predicted Fe-S protein YdhL (DUF1289 family)
MSDFTPCKGLATCRDDGQSCLTCGRGLDEIARLRDLIDGLADLAVRKDYDNVEHYLAYVTEKVAKKIRHRRAQEDN